MLCALRTHVVDNDAQEERESYENRGRHYIPIELDILAWFLFTPGLSSIAPICNFHKLSHFDIARPLKTNRGFYSTGNASRANAAAKAVVKGSSVRFHSHSATCSIPDESSIFDLRSWLRLSFVYTAQHH